MIIYDATTSLSIHFLTEKLTNSFGIRYGVGRTTELLSRADCSASTVHIAASCSTAEAASVNPVDSSPPGDDHEMCFNGAKTYQLGWRPSSDLVVGTYLTISLTSFADCNANAGHLCIIKVVALELFSCIRCNRQIGSNSQTREYGNKVMVATTGTSGEYSDLQSWAVAILDSGGSFDVPNFGGSIFDMSISVIASIGVPIPQM